MGIKRRKRITFLFALLGAMVSLVVFYLELTELSTFGLDFSPITLVVGIVCLFLVWYLIIYWAIQFYHKNEIQKAYELIPDLQKNSKAENVETLSQQITNLTLDKSQEIDLLLERENYRREFIGNVSHELKTPIFTIQGYLLTLIEGGVEDESIRDRYLNRINKSVERLTYIVKDLDLIAELEHGNLKLNRYPFNLVALTQEVFDLLEIKAQKNNIQLRFDKTYVDPIKVDADIERIEQVLTNLIANAINHSGRNATVTVSFQTEGEQVKVTIEDTGQGIPENHLKRIFERFYRVEQSRSRQKGGSGLGLAIVKHILEAHDQKIYVNSTVGVGTTFKFHLHKV